TARRSGRRRRRCASGILPPVAGHPRPEPPVSPTGRGVRSAVLSATQGRTPMTRTAAQIRADLGHPVIDADGHAIEVTPVLLDYIEAVGGPAVVDRYLQAPVKRQFRLRQD